MNLMEAKQEAGRALLKTEKIIPFPLESRRESLIKLAIYKI